MIEINHKNETKLEPKTIYHLAITMNGVEAKKVTSKEHLDNDIEKLIKKNFKDKKGKLQIDIQIKILSEHGKTFEK
jgi:hypothetical protein